MRFSWGAFYLFLFFYRSFFSFLSEAVIARLTSLGDAPSYQTRAAATSLLNTDVLNLNSLGGSPITGMIRHMATEITFSAGGVFHILFGGNAVMINIGFQAIAFVGIVVLLRAVEPKIRIWLAALLMMPSFTIWSSVAGKESIVVFAVGILGAYIIRLFKNEARFGIPQAFSVFLIYLFKSQYLPALMFLIGSAMLARRIQKKSFFVLAFGFLTFSPIYVFRERIAEMSFAIIPNFSTGNLDPVGGSRSTRAPFWVEQYDVFWKMPEGMFLAFFGPTLVETQTSLLLLASYIESLTILLILILITVSRLRSAPFFMVALVGFTLFWLLFGVYPFGVMNPGTAIRYRTGYEIIIFVAIIVLLSRQTYVDWQGGRRESG